MGCQSCGGGKAHSASVSGEKKFVVYNKDGSSEKFETETAARAYNAKNGGSGLVKRLK